MIFKRTRESKSHRRSVREDEKKKKESLILLLVVEVYRVFAKRRRTGVVRLFYVLVSLVFVGGGCVDMKVRKLSLAFFAALFEKKILLKFERNVKVVFCRVVVQKSRVLREEREKFL